jgi:CubicO group peptidase (beta-lactamase class C family)
MKKIIFKMFVCVLSVCVLTGFLFPLQTKVNGNCHNYDNLKQQLDAYFRQLVEERTFSGSVLIEKDGVVLLKKGYGKSDYEKGKNNHIETNFNIASMNKAFTAMCILILEERGILSVNDTVDQFIPEYPNGNLITLHHLMTHTSGIYAFINDPIDGLQVDSWRDFDKFFTPEGLMELFMYRPLYFEPGTDWSYANSNFILLGVIIERVTGMTYAEFLKTNILDPLKMNHTFYDPYEKTHEHQKAVGYENINGDIPEKAIYWNPSLIFSAGGIFSTVKDLEKWSEALQSEKLVSRATLQKMFTPIQGYIFNYAYGWFIFDELYNGQVYKHIWHGGAMPGYHSAISLFPEDNLTVIILENLSAPTEDVYTFDLKIIPEQVALMILNR